MDLERLLSARPLFLTLLPLQGKLQKSVLFKRNQADNNPPSLRKVTSTDSGFFIPKRRE
jgi:hypothetical protein